MKKTIMFWIMFGMVLTSLGGCFIPYYDDGGGHRRHGGDRYDRWDHRR